MVKPFEKTLKQKDRKTMSETKRVFEHEKPKKVKCPVTGKPLSGVAHAIKCKAQKLSKTQKRPSVPFGGTLSTKAREQVFIETGKVISGIKNIDDVDNKYKQYVMQAIKRAK
jgi:ribosomal protein L34E